MPSTEDSLAELVASLGKLTVQLQHTTERIDGQFATVNEVLARLSANAERSSADYVKIIERIDRLERFHADLEGNSRDSHSSALEARIDEVTEKVRLLMGKASPRPSEPLLKNGRMDFSAASAQRPLLRRAPGVRSPSC